MKYSGNNIFESFAKNSLSEKELMEIMGGTMRGKPKSRDRDIFDIEDEDKD